MISTLIGYSRGYSRIQEDSYRELCVCVCMGVCVCVYGCVCVYAQAHVPMCTSRLCAHGYFEVHSLKVGFLVMMMSKINLER